MSSASTWLTPLATGLIGAAAGATAPLLHGRQAKKHADAEQEEEDKRNVLKAIAEVRAQALAWNTRIDRLCEFKRPRPHETDIERLKSSEASLEAVLDRLRTAVYMLVAKGFPVNGDLFGSASPLDEMHRISHDVLRIARLNLETGKSRAFVDGLRNATYAESASKVRQRLDSELKGRAIDILDIPYGQEREIVDIPHMGQGF